MRRRAARTTTLAPEPPSVPGHPILGNALQFMRDPVALLRQGAEEHGRVFSVRLGNKPAVVLLGPEHTRFFFEETDKLLSIREAYPFFRKMFHENLYFFADPPEYKEQRKILIPPFQGRKLSGYIDAMTKEMRAFGTRLGDSGEFDLAPTLAPLIMDINASSLLGSDCREELGPSFLPEFHRFREGTEFVLPLWLPIPRLLRSQAAKKRLHAMLSDLLARRRAVPREPADLIQTLAEARYSDGRAVPDHIIVNMILVLQWAGYETTTGQTSWALIELLRNPEYLRSVVAEQDAVLADDPERRLDTLTRLERLGWGVSESVRLHPMAFLMMRAAAADFEVAGFHVRKGSLVLASPAVSQRLSDVFPDPDAFHPERFAAERRDGTQHSGMIAFGGGLHRCVGMHYANLVMKVVIGYLLENFELELVDPDPGKGSGSKPRWPISPCRVRYQRRKSEGAL
ncbi:cytochrome P450 [Spongiactinospora sp. TRM90649]|uniref:cytochrome P450 n=1 Tax=Spongiactinospora sp. TRM90649 TaxID=3031114 RepID=UPI0023F8AA00|nr:cytochrome P450 [Spongiactinospora sp. TRM90649]MDF5756244.1 cytochrome P450 [Spongiactinospora sp. TRM90649]